MTVERRESELERLGRKYGKVEHGPNLDWVLFKTFPLPPSWNRETTELLVLIPAGYPTTPPDNFFVREGLRLANGAMPQNYSEGQTINGSRWAQFSFHAKGWNPTPDPEEGDSLITFMLSVEKLIQEGR